MIEHIPQHFGKLVLIPYQTRLKKKLEDDFRKEIENYKLTFIENFKEVCNIIKKMILRFKSCLCIIQFNADKHIKV